MEISLKKTTAAVIALGLSGLASASGYAPACTKYDVSIPCQVSGWDLGFEALVAEPMNQQLFYVASGSPSVRYQVDPKFKFGFRLEGSYHFGHGNDATLNWTRFDQDYNGALPSAVTSGSIGRASFKYDLVNLELAQHFDVGPRLDLRAYAGPSFMRLDQFADTNNNVRFSSKFHGGGLRAGVDSMFQIGSGFGLAVHASSGLVVGDAQAENFNISTAGVVTSTAATTNIDTRTVVPFGEAKMGLNYSTGSSWGNASLEGGYFLSNSCGSVHHLSTSNGALPNAVSVSDFGLHGFYFTGKVDTSVA